MSYIPCIGRGTEAPPLPGTATIALEDRSLRAHCVVFASMGPLELTLLALLSSLPDGRRQSLALGRREGPGQACEARTCLPAIKAIKALGGHVRGFSIDPCKRAWLTGCGMERVDRPNNLKPPRLGVQHSGVHSNAKKAASD